jgi:hypothetical protein
MNLYLFREPSNDVCTFGSLFCEEDFLCYTLEDPIRDKKIPDITAIPAGKYRVRLTYSPRFKKQLPLLIDVPQYEGVRIHAGNWARDTEGCLLVGMERNDAENMVLKSQRALARVVTQIGRAVDANQLVYITIRNP